MQATNRALVYEVSVYPTHSGAQEPLQQDKVVGPLQAKLTLSPFQPKNPESTVNSKQGSLDFPGDSGKRRAAGQHAEPLTSIVTQGMEIYLCESLRCWVKYTTENTQKVAATPSPPSQGPALAEEQHGAPGEKLHPS